MRKFAIAFPKAYAKAFAVAFANVFANVLANTVATVFAKSFGETVLLNFRYSRNARNEPAACRVRCTRALERQSR